jgi:Beta-lactamase
MLVVNGISASRWVSSRVTLTRTAANVLQAMLFMFLVEPLASAAEPGVEQRVWQVENELLPPVLVKGETPSKSTLSERMQVLHVPGVSVAVIHRGKIEWARGFGVTKEAGAAVNPHTLFQAASISKAVATVVVMKLIQAGKIDLAIVGSELRLPRLSDCVREGRWGHRDE